METDLKILTIDFNIHAHVSAHTHTHKNIHTEKLLKYHVIITSYNLLFSIRLIYITLPMCSSVHFHFCVDNESFSDACVGQLHLS